MQPIWRSESGMLLRLDVQVPLEGMGVQRVSIWMNWVINAGTLYCIAHQIKC